MQNMKDIAMLLAINHMTGSQSETCVSQMATADLSALKDSYMKEYEAYQCKKWKLDMSRGKPGPDQLVLSAPMLDVLTRATYPLPMEPTAATTDAWMAFRRQKS